MNKEFFETEILVQKMRSTPDKNYIQMVQQLIEKDDLPFSAFINTGRLMEVAHYQREFVSHPYFKENCTDIMRYIGGYCIQGLKTGEWLFDLNDAEQSDEQSTTFRSHKLSDVEHWIYDNVIAKKLKLNLHN